MCIGFKEFLPIFLLNRVENSSVYVASDEFDDEVLRAGMKK